MSLSGVSSNPVVSSYVQPVKPQPIAQTSHAPQGAYSVSVSSQARQLANDGDTQAQEAQESSPQAATEKANGIA